MQSPTTNLVAWAIQIVSSATALLLNVPSEFWTQVLDVMAVPDEVKTFSSPFLGATCSTIVEVIAAAIALDNLRKAGKLTPDYHDPTARFWPLKIFVGSMTGLICMAIFSPAVVAIVPKAPPWTVGFIAGAGGYWFLSKRLPGMLNKNKDDDDTN